MNYRRRTKPERSERWQREDASPRLAESFPSLRQLRLEVRELRGEHVIPGTESVRHIIVQRAGTQFEVSCGEPKCEGGGYDVTSQVMSELKRGTKEFRGQDSCAGNLGEHPCQRVLEFVARAQFE